MPLPLVLIAPNALPSNIIIIQASFEPGELKKMLAVETGLQPQEQRLIFMGKERDNSDFFNITGVKDKSKIVLIEDPSSWERKYIEMKRNAKIEYVFKAVFEVSTEVDKLANQLRRWNMSFAVKKVKYFFRTRRRLSGIVKMCKFAGRRG